jgi:hypothetical protein
MYGICSWDDSPVDGYHACTITLRESSALLVAASPRLSSTQRNTCDPTTCGPRGGGSFGTGSTESHGRIVSNSIATRAAAAAPRRGPGQIASASNSRYSGAKCQKSPSSQTWAALTIASTATLQRFGENTAIARAARRRVRSSADISERWSARSVAIAPRLCTTQPNAKSRSVARQCRATIRQRRQNPFFQRGQPRTNVAPTARRSRCSRQGSQSYPSHGK